MSADLGDGDFVRAYLNNLAMQLSNKYKHVNDTTRLFFTCKEKQGSSDEWVWFNGVRSNMKGIIYERAARRGEQTNASAPPIYPATWTRWLLR